MFLLPLAIATACSLTTGGNESQTLTVDVDSQKRTAEVVIGISARVRLSRGEKVPLVYVWHGFGGAPKGMRRAFAPALDAAVGVFPQGLERTFPGFGKRARPGWQIQADDLGERDLKFFDALHQNLVDTGCVDEDRVTTTGFSNGALFSNVLGCYRPQRLAAIALVSGAGPGDDAKCAAPLPAFVVHGTKDRVLPFKMGEKTAATWSAVNGCKTPVATPAPGSCAEASGCQAPVQFCAHGRGHRVPSATRKAVATFLLQQTRAKRVSESGPKAAADATQGSSAKTE